MRRRDPDMPEPPWVAAMSDQEIVEKFQALIRTRSFTYERIGRECVDMRKRLLKILIDGLAANTRTN